MTVNTPAEATSHVPEQEVPFYFAGGFGYGQQRNEKVLGYIASLGYKTVPPLPDPDLGESDARFHVIEAGVEHSLSRQETMRLIARPAIEQSVAAYQRKRAEDLLVELQGRERVNAIFQSADALNGLIAMHAQPNLFANAVLAYPAGIIKQPRPFKAARGVLKSVSVGRRRNHAVTESFEDQKTMSRFGRSKTAGGFVTAASVALSYQGSLLSEIREQEHTPGISLVLGVDDWMIRPERVLETLDPDDVDYILVTNTPHGIKGRKDVMHEILKLFPMMEKAKQDRREGRITPPLVDRMIFMGVSPRKESELRDIAYAIDLQSTDN